MILTREDLLEMYRLMLLTRKHDERVVEIYARKGLPELPHTSIGEEAVGIGCSYKLRPDDYILPSLRDRGMFYAKGVSFRTMMAGMYGKRTGPAKSKATSHHMGDLKLGVLAGSGLIGSSIPLAVGAALGIKQLGKDSVVITTFGDGASSRGDCHESMNLAAVWQLPVIFVIGNNGYAISTPQSKQMAVKDLAVRAQGYGMPGYTIDGNDIMAVFATGQEAIARARRGEGPTLIECKTNRWRGHAENDRDLYRTQEDREAMRQDCPIERFEKYLKERDILNPVLKEQIEKSVLAEIEDAVRFAEESPFPAPEEAEGHVYAD